MNKRKNNLNSWAIDALMFILSSICIGISTACFAEPNKLAPGGVTGLSTVLKYLFGWHIGTLNLFFNIPLFIWALLEFFGKWKAFLKFISKTFVATVLNSLGIRLMEEIVKNFQDKGINLTYTEDQVVATIVSGVLTGIGLGLVFMRGGTTGGTDLVAKLSGMHLRHISIGNLLLFSDLVVILFAAIVYREISSPIYSCVVTFVATKIIDMMLYGANPATGKIMFIVSQKNEDIANRIIKDLNRGVTHLKSRGGYSDTDGEVIMCALRKNEVHAAYEIIHEFDETAFAIVGDAGEITGLGFGDRLEIE